MDKQQPVVVFDFDGTLVHGDSVAGFIVEYLRSRPGRLLFMLPVLPVALVLFGSRRTLSAGVALVWWSLTCGTRARTLVRAMRRYAETTLAPRGNATTLAELAEHWADGHSVVIATAAPPLIVQGLLRARGLRRARVVGTRLVRRLGGLVPHPHCLGETKLVELRRRFGLTHWAEVYTDSALDLPLMRHASKVTLVEPHRFTHARVERALGAGVSVRVLDSR